MSLTKVSYSMIQGAPVNVLDYGADPTGVADSTQAIQDAIDTGNSVYLPTGTYKTSSTLTFNTTFQNFTGDGTGSKIRYTGTGIAILIDGTASPAYRILSTFGDFFVEGNSGASAGTGIKVSECANVLLQNIYIRSFNVGLFLKGSLISNFNNVYCLENLTVGILMETGVVIASPVNLVSFNYCQVVGGSSEAVRCTEGASITFNSCEFEAVGQVGNAFPICNFTDMGTTGISPAVIFNSCWFEANEGVADIYYRGFDTNSGLSITGTNFYSTSVTSSIDVDDGIISIFGCGINPVVSGNNLLIGSGVSGSILGCAYLSLSNSSTNVTIQTSKQNSYRTPVNTISGQGFGVFRTGSSGSMFKINNLATGNRLDFVSDVAADEFYFANNIYLDGAWNTSLLRMGAYRLWVDSSGNLRIKNGTPTSATDGTVVGTQT